METISGYKPKSMYYRVYDENGKMKKLIEKKSEKSLNDDEWLRGVSCFVINEKNEVLIEKRVNKGLTPGKLDLCSGHVDKDETLTQAMIRELKEELGIDFEEAMRVIKLNRNAAPLKFESSGKKKNFFITFYCLKRNSSEVKAQEQEVEKVVWLPLEEAFALIKSKRTKFPTDYDYEEIFQKVRDICNNNRENDEISK